MEALSLDDAAGVQLSQDTLLDLLAPLWEHLDLEAKRKLRSTSTELRGFVDERVRHLDCTDETVEIEQQQRVIQLCERLPGLRSLKLSSLGAVRAAFDDCKEGSAPACCPRLAHLDVILTPVCPCCMDAACLHGWGACSGALDLNWGHATCVQDGAPVA
jgi:hypothetical protein